jgi:hypothetical protein
LYKEVQSSNKGGYDSYKEAQSSYKKPRATSKTSKSSNKTPKLFKQSHYDFRKKPQTMQLPQSPHDISIFKKLAIGFIGSFW